MQNSDEQDLDEQVLNTYKEIFSLPSPASIEVLHAYWRMLAENCTPENPCIECRREIKAQMEDTGG